MSFSFRTSVPEVSVDHDDPSLPSDLRRLSAILVPFGAAGTLGTVLYASGGQRFWVGWGAILLAASAAAAAGALLGLLFGIPRLLSQGERPTGPGPTNQQATVAASGPVAGRPSELRYGGNSNLEQVSDWLTKIIIGATLVQFRDLCAWLGQIARWCASGLGRPESAAFSGAVLLFFGIWGFLVSYLLTRRVLPAMILRGDQGGAPNSRALAGGTLIMRERAQGDSTTVAVSPGLVRLAKQVTATPRAQVSSADWGRAQLLQRDFSSAAESLADAVIIDPNDPALVEDLMFSSLYVKPKGFLQALEAGARVNNKTSRMWVYLACALGQQYKWEMEENHASPEQLKKIRDSALEAVHKALSKDHSQKALLASLLNAPAGSTEDDLAVFRGDQDFQTILQSK